MQAKYFMLDMGIPVAFYFLTRITHCEWSDAYQELVSRIVPIRLEIFAYYSILKLYTYYFMTIVLYH